jgi:acyl-CoA synthetase (AMP-forming)/AMP-acid ligase II/1-acyl-sn-glycerol-3-phosphate acyltransferase/acyl carrier protein
MKLEKSGMDKKGEFLALIGRTLLKLRYRTRIEGLDAVLAKGRKGILLLPNHPAYLDSAVLFTNFFPYLRPHILADKDHMAKPLIRGFVRRIGIIPIPDPAVHGESSLPEIAQILQNCSEGLRQGENYLLNPSGRVYLSRFENLGGNSAVETILSGAPDTRVVLIRTTGFWGSSFSKAVDRHPDWQKCILRGFRSLLANFIFFGPRRELRVTVVEPLDFPKSAGRLAMNRYMEAFYNQDAPQARYVPYTIWERGGVRDLPEPVIQRIEGNPDEVPNSIREQLFGKLAELSGKTAFPDTALLAKDLGLDSLARMELQVWIEHEFGHEVPDPESIQTVGDCLIAAFGKTVGTAQPDLKPPKSSWFKVRLPMEIPEGDTLAEVFLRQAARDLNRIALADLQGGQRSYRDLFTGIFALKPRIEALKGERVGIMLPASGAAVVAYLSILFSGKVPVMVNWTAGSRNLIHGLRLLGVERVLTSSQLVSKLESKGLDFSGIRDRFWLLEELSASLTLTEKLAAFLRARFSWSSLHEVKIPETAVVIFTSGSESLPKAVPLTHRNLLSNARGILAIFPFEPMDRMIGFLPPFHSFGLTVTMLLPLCTGLPVVYFSNPTDGGALARLIETYQATILVGTPTFLSGIVRSASDKQLASLRMAAAGAEKCPESLYSVLEHRWPQLRVLEGYGITECSPVLSFNLFNNPRHGTIGKPLPGVEHILVDIDTGAPVESGKAGMLLVRGPNIFGGYLNYDGDSPFVEFDGKTWYRTGDLVREEPDGTLVFTGRLKRFVKLGGELISLPAVEEALLGHFAREDDKEIPLAVESTPSEDHPELVLFSIRPITREAANDVLGKIGLSPLHFIRQVRQVEAIPVLGTGKTDYRALKAALELNKTGL